MNKITFSELVEKIALQTGQSKNFVRKNLKEALLLLQEGLLENDSVSLPGLGKFDLTLSPERNGVNPKTGEAIIIPEQYKIKYKADAKLREFINRSNAFLKPEILEDMVPSTTINTAEDEKAASETEDITDETDEYEIEDVNDQDVEPEENAEQDKEIIIQTAEEANDDIVIEEEEEEDDDLEYEEEEDDDDLDAEMEEEHDVADDPSSELVSLDQLSLPSEEKIPFATLVQMIAVQTEYSKRSIYNFLKESIDLIADSLSQEGKVSLSDLGHFYLKWEEERLGRNPQTGETISIPAQNRLKFRAQSELRKLINREFSDLKPEILEEEEIISEEIQEIPEEELIYAEEAKEQPPTESISPEIIAEQENIEPEPELVKEEVTSPPIRPQEMSDIRLSKTTKKRPKLVYAIVILLLMFVSYLYFLKSPSEPPKAIKEPVKTAQITNALETPVVEPKIEPKATPKPKPVAQPKYTIHRVKPGESLWRISRRYYQETYYWPNIYRANLAKINNPDYVRADISLRIPTLLGKHGSLARRDLTDIAKGYVEVYLAYKRLGKKSALDYLWVAYNCDVPEVIDYYRPQISRADLVLIKNIQGKISF
jgi:nucleoid DNA-binding protein/LysM repeat protein